MAKTPKSKTPKSRTTPSSDWLYEAEVELKFRIAMLSLLALALLLHLGVPEAVALLQMVFSFLRVAR